MPVVVMAAGAAMEAGEDIPIGAMGTHLDSPILITDGKFIDRISTIRWNSFEYFSGSSIKFTYLELFLILNNYKDDI
jgi:hypothetical protein